MTKTMSILRLLTAVLVLGLTAPVLSASAQQLKIGVVDLEQIIDGFNQARAQEDALNKERDALAKRIQEMQARGLEMLKQLKDVEKEIITIRDDTTLSQEAKEEKLKAPMEGYKRRAEDVKEFGKKLEDYRNAETEKLKQEFVDFNNKVVLQVAAAVRGYAQKNGYDFVFNQNQKSPAASDIVYAGKGEDITAQVIQYINSLPAEAPAPKPAS